MKVHIDPELCIGCSLCNDIAPDVFDYDDDGFLSKVIVDEVPEGQEDLVQEAIDECPTEAIIEE